MNLALLLAALLPWAASPRALVTRIFFAVSVLSIEMQIVTISGVGALDTLPPVNAVLAGCLIAWQWKGRLPAAGSGRPSGPPMPWAAIALLAACVGALNAWLPLQAADPYHLERMAQIERLGTLGYDPGVDAKINVVGWVYELTLADFRQIPLVGAALVKMHGLLGLLLYVVTLAAVFAMLPPGATRWPMVALLLVPPLFHQLVLIKNDLFLAAPALVGLTWLVARGNRAAWPDAAWAGWLVGFAIGAKATHLPLAVVMAGGLVVHGRGWRPVAGLALGGLLGVAAGGLPVTMWENVRWYGDAFASGPVAEMGDRNSGVADMAASVARFGISLVDLGLLTPRLWPDRGGWGGAFGLPFVWALTVLILSWRRAPEARWALAIAGFQFAVFAAAFPDADLAHRLVMAPALLAIVVAVHLVGRPGDLVRPARLALVPVLALSAAQILRSAVLYLARA